MVIILYITSPTNAANTTLFIHIHVVDKLLIYLDSKIIFRTNDFWKIKLISKMESTSNGDWESAPKTINFDRKADVAPCLHRISTLICKHVIHPIITIRHTPT